MTDRWFVDGRDLDPVGPRPGQWQRVVALLNVWNDLPELRRTLDSWYPHVDEVIAVDGAYRGVRAAQAASADGTLELLRSLPKVRLIEATDFWPDQCYKRSQYFRYGRPGDLCWRIDADEVYTNAAAIRQTPDLDVGWLEYRSPLYTRPQHIPTVFRWVPGLEIRTRHHWTYCGDDLVSTHQIGGPGLEHRLLPISFENATLRGSALRSPQRKATAQDYRNYERRVEKRAAPDLVIIGLEPVRVLQLAPLDPGLVVYRLHSAINTTSPHVSAMGISQTDWLAGPVQYQIPERLGTIDALAREADVIHCHVSYAALAAVKGWQQLRQRRVMHHHGSHYRQRPDVVNGQDVAQRAALRLVSNLELLQYGEGLEWLPNPVPVARYRRLARPAPAGPFRVAHSPTKKQFKATDVFLRVIERLQAQGLPLEPVLIHQIPHTDALRLKATCHAAFDSFWLGIQCSGLESAAMGQPVIAGDEHVAAEYRARLGEVPYTFANDEQSLAEALERLVTDPAWRGAEARRVGRYVEQHHDYAAVTGRYLDLLDHALDWRVSHRIGRMTG